jgi:hypothetical protein
VKKSSYEKKREKMVGEERKGVKEKEGNSTHHHHKVACFCLWILIERYRWLKGDW